MLVKRLIPYKCVQLVSAEPCSRSRGKDDNGKLIFHPLKSRDCFEHATPDGSRLVGNRMAVRDFRPCIDIPDLKILTHLYTGLEHPTHNPCHLCIYRYSPCHCNN